MSKIRWLSLFTLLALALPILPASNVAAQGNCRTFNETGKQVCGRFLDYWNTHGGLAQQGYPISNSMQEKSDTNGQVYTVQYFERAVFESHPENAAPNDVLLSLLGVFFYKSKYPSGAPGQTANNTAGSVLFQQTGHRVGGVFLQYWQSHGGLAQQGYPISDEFKETSATNGQTYTVQYFERAVFEAHPENPAPNNVLLSLLGVFQYQRKYQGGNNPTPVPAPPAPSSPQNKDGAVAPTCGVAGTTFRFTGWGFTPNEPVSYWITAPNQAVIGTANPIGGVVNNDGTLPVFQLQTDASFAQLPGWWAVTFQGAYSNHQSIVYFRIVATADQCSSNPNPQPQPTQAPPPPSSGPQSKDGAVAPTCGVAGTTFQFTGWGFTPSEPVSYWITAPNQSVIGTSNPINGVVNNDGTLPALQLQTDASFAQLPGWWAVTFEGAYSHHQSIVYFRIVATADQCGR